MAVVGNPDDRRALLVEPGEALDVLTRAVQDLSLAVTAEDVQRIVRTAARRLVAADGATFVLRDAGQCYYVDEDAIAPLWKGQRFPMTACISGWTMLHGEQAVIEDITADERIPQDAYRPTFVKSLVMTPVRSEEPVGAIGMYWATRHRPSLRETGLARALADSTAVALEYVQTLRELSRAEHAAETDALTGVLNRRGWHEAIKTRMSSGAGPWAVAMLDLDEFKQINDERGHGAGDDVLRQVAGVWRTALRPADVLARVGGDEFAVLLDRCSRPEATDIVERLIRAARPWTGVSAGLAWRDRGPTGLVERADELLYQAKRAGGGRVVVGEGPADGGPVEIWAVEIAG